MNTPMEASPARAVALRKAVNAAKIAARDAEPKSHWETLTKGDGEDGPETFEELMKQDLKKKRLLGLARSLSPMNTALKISLFPRTVIPRLFQRQLTWVVLGTWIGTSACARMGITEGDIDTGVFDGAGTMVTFMIIFYVGYCYTRYTDQFTDVQTIMRSVISATAQARACFGDDAEVEILYRYLNMLHVAAYCGLSPNYSEKAFFKPLCEKHKLFGEGEQRIAEQMILGKIGIDSEGGRAWQLLYVWSLQVINREFKAGHISPPVHAQLTTSVNDIADSCGNLYAFSYQVLPFIYTQLVSLACTIYLTASAFLKGVHFTPSNSYTFGLIVPAFNVILTTLAVFGLLEVGDTIMDPFGGDPEDYAVVHFVEHTACASKEAVLCRGAPKVNLFDAPVLDTAASAASAAQTRPMNVGSELLDGSPPSGKESSDNGNGGVFSKAGKGGVAGLFSRASLQEAVMACRQEEGEDLTARNDVRLQGNQSRDKPGRSFSRGGVLDDRRGSSSSKSMSRGRGKGRSNSRQGSPESRLHSRGGSPDLHSRAPSRSGPSPSRSGSNTPLPRVATNSPSPSKGGMDTSPAPSRQLSQVSDVTRLPNGDGQSGSVILLAA